MSRGSAAVLLAVFGTGVFLDPLTDRCQFLLIFFRVRSQIRMFALGIFIPCVIEECHGFIIFLMYKRIIGMRVTLNAAHSGTLPYLPRCADAVNNRCHAELFIFGPAFIVVHCISVKGRGY